MGHRLSKIYTKTGDDGTTGMGDGSRLPKDHVRLEAIGEVDELNSLVGMVAVDSQLTTTIRESLLRIQHDLFDLGGELSIPNYKIITADHVIRLENELDAFNADLPYLKEFILPGGHPTAAVCHVARAVCRCSERRLVTLSRQETLNPQATIYLNRLSDLLFVMARVINKHYHSAEVYWEHERNR